MTQSAQAPVPIGNTIDSLGRQPGALGLVVALVGRHGDPATGETFRADEEES